MKLMAIGSLKFAKLKRRLQLPHWQAVGLLESLWLFVQQNCPDGAIGRFSNEDIAAGIEWSGDADILIASLTEIGWLDSCRTNRLIVHDWHEHCPNYVKGNMKKNKKPFAQHVPLDVANGTQQSAQSSEQAAKELAKEPAKQTAQPLEQPAEGGFTRTTLGRVGLPRVGEGGLGVAAGEPATEDDPPTHPQAKGEFPERYDTPKVRKHVSDWCYWWEEFHHRKTNVIDIKHKLLEAARKGWDADKVCLSLQFSISKNAKTWLDPANDFDVSGSQRSSVGGGSRQAPRIDYPDISMNRRKPLAASQPVAV